MSADVSDPAQMQACLSSARQRFGSIDGVIHAAGTPGGGLIQLGTPEASAQVLAPKVEGTSVLMSLLADAPPDFVVLCSSITAILGGPGQADYCGANACLDAFAHVQAIDHRRPRVISVNWDVWQEVGMAVNTPVPYHLRAEREDHIRNGILPTEGPSGVNQTAIARPCRWRTVPSRPTAPAGSGSAARSTWPPSDATAAGRSASGRGPCPPPRATSPTAPAASTTTVTDRARRGARDRPGQGGDASRGCSPPASPAAARRCADGPARGDPGRQESQRHRHRDPPPLQPSPESLRPRSSRPRTASGKQPRRPAASVAGAPPGYTGRGPPAPARAAGPPPRRSPGRGPGR